MASLLHPTSGIPNLGSAVISVENINSYTIYSPDKPGEEAAENARVWNVYLDEAHEYDMDMIQGFRNIIDGLLVFAALFSGVVTTFVAQTSQALQPDNSQITVSLLIETNALLRAAGNKTSLNAVPTASLGPESQTRTSIDVWVNGLFFTSLSLSLSTALLSVLAKQWIHAYTAIVPGDAKTRAVTRHFRFQGIMKWRLGDIIESLPLILHCSVAIFLVGLSLYISQLSRPICGVVAGISALTVLFYFVSSMIPAFDVGCPYRIPFMFPLAQLLFFIRGLIRYAYLKLRNKAQQTLWPHICTESLKMVEKKQVLEQYSGFPSSELLRNSLVWVFDHSSNHSVKEIVMDGTCGLLAQVVPYYLSYHSSMAPLFSSQEDKHFVSGITYALSRLPDISSTSSEEEGFGESTVYGQLVAAFMEFSFEKAPVDLSTSFKDWKQQIMDALLDAYKRALIKKHRTLSWSLLKWADKLFQLDNLRHVVDEGIDLDCHDSQGWTVLHWAAVGNNLDVVIALVEQKPALMSALATWEDISALTPLDVAVISQSKPDNQNLMHD
ncbi:hypothetical protein C0992_011862 [Termitomyces sp. T32_za158]|nr:hypothetical protein C0992_011862 [Termitomyces sp. T32_za158]